MIVRRIFLLVASALSVGLAAHAQVDQKLYSVGTANRMSSAPNWARLTTKAVEQKGDDPLEETTLC